MDFLVGLQPLHPTLASDLTRAWALLNVLHKEVVTIPEEARDTPDPATYLKPRLKTLKEATFLLNRAMEVLRAIRAESPR